MILGPLTFIDSIFIFDAAKSNWDSLRDSESPVNAGECRKVCRMYDVLLVLKFLWHKDFLSYLTDNFTSVLDKKLIYIKGHFTFLR